MKYSVEVETSRGDVLRFPHYSAAERMLAMSIARIQSEHSAVCSVLSDGKVIIRYTNGSPSGHLDWAVLNDEDILAAEARRRFRGDYTQDPWRVPSPYVPTRVGQVQRYVYDDEEL
jgi:hypothetical protein